MENKKILGFAAVGVVLAVVAVYFIMQVTTQNSEVRLRNRADAQLEKNKTTQDTCWKIISGKASVAEKHKDGFKDVYVAMMGARGLDKGGTFMKWVQESNPNFDSSLYKSLSSAIEGQRTLFKRDQQMLIDIKREHDNLLETWPSSMFVGDREPLAIVVVTSTKTQEVFNTGLDDESDPFK